jgi:Tfp pilus assembly protein PilV
MINNKGFGMVELLFAICILSMTLLSAGMMNIMTIKNNFTGNRQTESVMAAQTVLEELTNQMYNDPNSVKAGVYTKTINRCKVQYTITEPSIYYRDVVVKASFNSYMKQKPRTTTVRAKVIVDTKRTTIVSTKDLEDFINN